MVEISGRDARRIALAAQGFSSRQPLGRAGGKVDKRHFRRVLEQLATVQLDSVNVLARSHELIFFARLGAYDRAALTRWLWSSREVFEYWGHEASVHPVERHPLLRWRMTADHQWGISKLAAEAPGLLDQIRETVLTQGPLTISELQKLTDDRRNGESWWGWTPTKRLVEHLFWKGEVTASRRGAFDRVYLAPDKWLPNDVLARPTPDIGHAQRQLLLTAAEASGLGTARDLADYYRMPVATVKPLLEDLVTEGELVAAQVEGWPQPAYLHPRAALPRRKIQARALLSPFDSLVWERQRTERIWGFRYRIEIYVPAAKRVHGYYVLPFLLGEDLVARVDLKADRQAGILRVRAAWIEDGDTHDPDHVAGELGRTLTEMADWLGLAKGVEVDLHGTLATRLAAHF
jgi:hypothetical protein